MDVEMETIVLQNIEQKEMPGLKNPPCFYWNNRKLSSKIYTIFLI